MTFTKHWCDIDHATHTNSNTQQHIESMNYVFANRSEDEEIYPLTIKEIAEEQLKDKSLRELFEDDTISDVRLIEDIKVLWKVSHSKISPKPSSCMVVITITFNTLGTLVLKRLYVLRCIRKVCVLLSDRMSKGADPARLIII
jgi:hypothetical protein